MTVRVVLLAFACSVVMGSDATTNQHLKSWVALGNHDGSSASASISNTDFRQLVFELQQSRESPDKAGVMGIDALLLDQPQAYDQIATPRNNERHRMALSLLHWERPVVDEKASAQLMEGFAESELVETNVTVFAFSPVKSTTYRGENLEMVFSSDDIFEQVGSADDQLAELYLDSGDGQGLQRIEPDVPVEVSYDSVGEKALSLEAVTTDGSILYAQSTLQVAALSTPNPTQTVRVQGTSSYSDFWGTLYILKSGSHSGIRCPVFVVEGFDMNNDMDWDVLYNLLNSEQLAETLKDFGRDLVVMDFDNATDDIFGNASATMGAINYINSNRRSSSDKFTVIGASMGGLVSRRALATMDKYPSSYGYSDVDTWISFDSPQTGANIPLGLQQYFKFFSQFSSDYPDLLVTKEYLAKMDTIAAKEMLLHHHSNTSDLAGNPSWAWFWDSMNSYGYPTSCKTVAISNGSGYGNKQPFYPGQQIIQWHQDDGITLEIGSKIYAMPKYSASTCFYGRFDPWDWFDRIDETEYVRRYAPIPLDNAPGGTRDSFQELFDQLPYRSCGP